MKGKNIRGMCTYFNQFIESGAKTSTLLRIQFKNKSIEFMAMVRGISFFYEIEDGNISEDTQIYYVIYADCYDNFRYYKAADDISFNIKGSSILEVTHVTPPAKKADEAITETCEIKIHQVTLAPHPVFTEISRVNIEDFSNISTTHNALIKQCGLDINQYTFFRLSKNNLETISTNAVAIAYNKCESVNTLDDYTFSISDEYYSFLNRFIQLEPKVKTGNKEEVTISMLGEWIMFEKYQMKAIMKYSDYDKFDELRKLTRYYNFDSKQELTQEIIDEIARICNEVKEHELFYTPLPFIDEKYKFSRMCINLINAYSFLESATLATVETAFVIYENTETSKHYMIYIGYEGNCVIIDDSEDEEINDDEDEIFEAKTDDELFSYAID